MFLIKRPDVDEYLAATRLSRNLAQNGNYVDRNYQWSKH